MVKAVRYNTRGWVSSLTLVLLCLVALPLHAQRIEIEAPESVEPGRHFKVIYSVAASDADLLESPQYNGLELLYGPAVSTSASIVSVNGRVQQRQQVSFVYTFAASKQGSASLSPIILEVGGKQVKSAPLKIKVLPPETRPTRQGEAHFMYRLLLPSKKTYYVQEAIPATYRFYGTQGFDPMPSLMQILEFDGFLSTDLFEGSAGERQMPMVQLNGRNYLSVDIHKYLLYPQREGELVIPSHEFPFRVTIPPTPSYPLGSMEQRSERTSKATIRVIPLPTEGKPKDFSGAVGHFTLQSEINTQTPSVGDALTIKLSIQGAGNLKVASAPSPQFEAAFDSYAPETQYDYSVETGQLQEQKTITYTLIPRKQGRFVIPPISFSYFDPSSAKYITLSGKGYQIDVAPAKRGAIQPLSVQGNLDKSLSSLPLQRTEGLAPRSTNPLVDWTVYLSLYALIMVVGIVTYLYLGRRDKARQDTVGYNATRANAVARKRLRRADELRSKADEEAFYQELLTALWGYLGHKLGLPPAELSRETISQILEQRGVHSLVIESCTQTIDAVEFARFAPGSASDKMQSIYTQAVEVISAIEDHKLDKR